MSDTEIDEFVRFGHNPAMKNRIKELREKAGLTFAQIANRLVPPSEAATISKLEKGQVKLTLEWMEKLAPILGCSTAEVAFYFDDVRRVPVIGWVSAGSWTEAVENTNEYVHTPHGGPKSFALRVKGLSMNRVAEEGEIIIIDPEDKDLIDKKLYVIINGGGEACFKQFRATEGPARFEPLSTEGTHKTVILGKEPLDIVGRVVSRVEKM